MTVLQRRKIISLCQQDLLNARAAEQETGRLRTRLAELKQRQENLQAECAAIAASLAGYEQQYQEFLAAEAADRQACEALTAQQAALLHEYRQLLAEHPEWDVPGDAAERAVADLAAAIEENEAVIAAQLADRETIIQQLAYLADVADSKQQQTETQAAIAAHEAQLQRLEREKQQLVHLLSLLTVLQPQNYVLLTGSRQEQIAAVAGYCQYLGEFAAIVQQVAALEQVPANHFLQQDISLLLERLTVIKQRQVDLTVSESEKIKQIKELVHLLSDTAADYGWLAKQPAAVDEPELMVSYQIICDLRHAVNDLLWVTPPGMMIKLGLCSQWKKTLLALLTKANSLEKLADSPEHLQARTITGLESLLLECHHLSQRIYEVCHRQLLLCGNELELADNRSREELQELAACLDSCSRQARTLAAPLPGLDDVIDLQQNLGKIENSVQQAQAARQQQTAALTLLQEEQQARQQACITAMNSQDGQELQARLDRLTEQRKVVAAALQEKTNQLEKTCRQVKEIKIASSLAQGRLESLRNNLQELASRLETVSGQLAGRTNSSAQQQTALLEAWISRLQTDGEQSVCSRPAPGRTGSAAAVQPAVASGEDADLAGIACRLAAERPGLVLLETREWQLPVAVTAVSFRLAGQRRCDLLEEFVLKCLAGKLAEPASAPAISQILRLEEGLVDTCLSLLVQYELLTGYETSQVKYYELTSKGQAAVASGLLPAADREGAVTIIRNAQYELLDWCEDVRLCPDEQLPDFRYAGQQEEALLRSYFPLDQTAIDRFVREQLTAGYTEGLADYQVRIAEPQYRSDGKLRFGEIWLYDLAAGQAVCRIWNAAQQKFCPQLETALMTLEGEWRSSQLAEISGSWLYREAAEAVAGSWDILYGKAGRQALQQACRQVRDHLLLLWPTFAELAAEEAVLQDLRELVGRNAVVFIGCWQHAAVKSQPAEANVLKILQNMVDADGLPGIFFFSLNNPGEKTVVVDQQYCLREGLPWQAFRGEAAVCAYPVVRSAAAGKVQELSRQLQGLFLQQLETQLVEGWLADETKCMVWFYALFRLREHRYIREILAEEGLEQAMAVHSGRTLFKLLALYHKTGQYECGFSRLVGCLAAKPEYRLKLVYWLEKLRARNLPVYNKIAAAYRELLYGQR